MTTSKRRLANLEAQLQPSADPFEALLSMCMKTDPKTMTVPWMVKLLESLTVQEWETFWRLALSASNNATDDIDPARFNPSEQEQWAWLCSLTRLFKSADPGYRDAKASTQVKVKDEAATEPAAAPPAALAETSRTITRSGIVAKAPQVRIERGSVISDLIVSGPLLDIN